MKREIKIGLFLAGAFLILAVIIFIVGDLAEMFRKPGYVLNVQIGSALGLEKSSDVKMAGIRIGYVKDIVLDQRRARVVMNIYPKFKVPKGSKATLASLGLLGERFMEIVPSGEAEYLAPGETLEAPAHGELRPDREHVPVHRRRDQTAERLAPRRPEQGRQRGFPEDARESLHSDLRAELVRVPRTRPGSARPSRTPPGPSTRPACACARSPTASTRPSPSTARWPARTARA